jgi:hypothetical protein
MDSKCLSILRKVEPEREVETSHSFFSLIITLS